MLNYQRVRSREVLKFWSTDIHSDPWSDTKRPSINFQVTHEFCFGLPVAARTHQGYGLLGRQAMLSKKSGSFHCALWNREQTIAMVGAKMSQSSSQEIIFKEHHKPSIDLTVAILMPFSCHSHPFYISKNGPKIPMVIHSHLHRVGDDALTCDRGGLLCWTLTQLTLIWWPARQVQDTGPIDL